MNIQTNYDPWSGYWYATDSETYDGLVDGNNTMGMGDTEQEAIDDLKEKLDSIRNSRIKNEE